MATATAFATTDPDVAERTLRAMYPEARLRDPGSGFRFALGTRGEEDLSVSRFQFSSHLAISIELDRTVAFAQWRSGSYRCAADGDAIDSAAPLVFGPGVIATSESEHLDQTVVNMSLDRLSRQAAVLLGTDDAVLSVTGTTPVSPALGAHWRRTLDFAERTLADDELLGNDLIRNAVLEQLRIAALAAFPISYRSAPRPVPGPATRSAGLRRAQRYIEQHADQPLTVSDVAGAAFVSVRRLHALFRDELGTTPLGYLQQVRLSAVRSELLGGDLPLTVAETARRWGFLHLGRFASLYRAAYGEQPRETLRRR